METWFGGDQVDNAKRRSKIGKLLEINKLIWIWMGKKIIYIFRTEGVAIRKGIDLLFS